MFKKRKILFIIPTVEKGGAERVFSTLLNNLNYTLFEVICVLYEDKIHYDLPLKRIKLICLNTPGSDLFFIKIISTIKRYFLLKKIYKSERPDVIYSFMTTVNITAVLSSFGIKFLGKLYISVHNMASLQGGGFNAFIIKLFIKKIYPLSSGIIAVSEGVKKDLIKNYSIAEKNISVIYNPIDIEYVLKQKSASDIPPELNMLQEKYIVNIGSLNRQKGQDDLIRALKIVVNKIDCKLMIIGEGPERANLLLLAKELGIGHRLVFMGFQDNPFQYLKFSKVFVSSSLWEGFGVAIVEAMACDVPVIATNCPSGPDEIIEDNIDGILIPVADPKTMANAIIRVLEDEQLSVRLKLNGLKKAEEFSVKISIKKYEALFLS